MVKIFNWIITQLQELWAVINKFLKETFRDILSKKIIDNLLVYLIYSLLIISICFAGFELFSKLYHHYYDIHPEPDNFPFVLEFAEYIFLYFLPIFILFGLLSFYELEWKRQINKSNKPNPNAQKNLTLSKKLFFSSVLSYLSLKIIDIIFFNFKGKIYNDTQLIAIGVFFIIITIIVLKQGNHKSVDEKH